MTRRWVGFALLVTLAAGCGTTGLNFRQDERVSITSPGDRAEVRLPVTVEWTVRDFEIVGRDGSAQPDAGLFGVFVDRAPQPPGEPLEWFAREDSNCRPPACPDDVYLSNRRIYTTTSTKFVIARVIAPSSQAPKRREFHDVTIVLLNGRGERIGESAFVRQFEVNR